VRGELACGNLRNRSEVLELLGNLPSVPAATDAEAMEFIERRALMGRGIGYIDVHLLASAALAGTARLWTRDRRLAAVAAELDLAFAEPT
jgi:predicted nucleic acid-binding protein